MVVKLTQRAIPSTEAVRRALGEPNRVIIMYFVYVDGRVVFGTADRNAAKAAARDLRDRCMRAAAEVAS